MHSGSCSCGAVQFDVRGELKPPDACHCHRCRKQSGHYFASTDVPKAALKVRGKDKLSWYQSSEKVRRGFCARCGSNLFWEPIYRDWIGIAMGAFDTLTQTKLAMHIYVADQGDYYQICDGLPQNPQ